MALSLGVAVSALAQKPAADPAAKAAKPNFAGKVKPIFIAHCVKCHGPEKQEGGLRLDHRASALRGGDSGKLLVAGQSAESEIIRRIALKDGDEKMPPTDKANKPLTPQQIALLKQWIDTGADWPKDDKPLKVTSDHWAFQPIAAVKPPQVKNKKSVRNAIDQFVFAKLEAKGIAPSPAADRYTLIKRLSYDLLGLPPTLEEVDAFVNDKSPAAYEKLVDRMLASDHFGERWGRHWLDKARYADSDGYEKDRARPNAWKYRDWVINAVNRDLPMDRFTIEQLAGDLLPEATPGQKIATAFHRQTLTNTEGGTDKEQFRVEACFDRVATTSTVWLGLTVGCAQCHTHKYDPVTQAEYYQLFAFFNNGDETTMPFPTSKVAVTKYKKDKPIYDPKLKALQAPQAAAKKRLEPGLAAWEVTAQEQLKADPKKIPEPIRKILAVEAAKRDKKQKAALLAHFLSLDPEYKKVTAEIAALQKQAPKSPYIQVRVVTQRATNPRKTFIFRRGEFLQPSAEVQAGPLAVLQEFKPRKKDAPADRLDMANWLMDPTNPLTPRVLANQVWAHLFGRGIVPTMNDFGLRGDKPTHPLLLDWLAGEYMRLKWSRKAFVKRIVMSATYRQSSHHQPKMVKIDPRNDLFHRQNRFRVEAEIVRDLNLSVSGLLSKKLGGPSVFPPMPADVAALSYAGNFRWVTSKGEDRYRRGLYTFFKRTSPHPNLSAFDCPDSNTTNVERRASNTPIQALILLNNEVFVDASQAMAKRLLTKNMASDGDRVAWAFRLCVARLPTSTETNHYLDLLDTARKIYKDRADDAKKMVGSHQPKDVPVSEAAAWVATARILMNMDEFITRE
jgi:mono/diheme cytochrome c family protein